MYRKLNLLVLVLTLATALASAAAETHPFSIHDALSMDQISDPVVSPKGTQIVFVQSKTDLDSNKLRADLWLVDVDGKNLRQLTTDPADDFNPRWSPDSKSVWFLSARSGSTQIWRIATEGGEAERITSLPLDVANLLVSRDGKYLAFALEVFPDSSTPAATKKKLDEITARKATGQIFDRLFIRHWDTWEDGRRSHLFVMPVGGGEPRDLMPGMDADVPSKPFGGTEEIAFAPDSRGLVFTARDAGKEEPWSTDFDLYYVPVDGSQQPQCLTDDNKAWDAQPIFSPDGRTLAYRAMTSAGCESDRFRIILRPWPEGQPRVLTESWDRSPWFVCWSADSKTIYAVAENIGNTDLFAVDVKTGGVKTFVREGAVSSPGVAGNRILFGLDHFKSPVELYSVNPDGKDMRPITQINSKKVSAARLGDFEQFSFQGWNDEIVYGTVVKPVDFNPAKKYPVAFLIHGGPEWSWVNYFNYLWNPQVFAGAGYAVVMIDFHGSTGYGQAFTDAIKGDWGGKPLVDLQKGLAVALERYPWMDEDRVGALGPSYGGYMVNWIAGNWPDRFRCLVNHAGVFDTRSQYYATEELWFPEWDLHGVPWVNPGGYEEQNPVNFVKNWKTPMLVIHGGNDFRVASTQGISAFTALQRRGIPSKLLYFTDENHWVLKPQNSILWNETVIGWLDQWLK